MKTVFKWSVYFFLTMLCGWLFVTHHIAKRTEQDVRHFLAQQQTHGTGLFRLQLIDYKRSWLKSTVTMAVHSDHDDIESIIGGSVLQSHIEHGPIILDNLKNRLVFAYSRSTTQFDPQHLNEQAAFIVSHLFDDQIPVIVHTETDFSSKFQYHVRVAPINYQFLGASASLTEGVIEGQYASFSHRHLITYRMGHMILKNDKTEWVARDNQLRFLLHDEQHDKSSNKKLNNVTDLPATNMSTSHLYQSVVKHLSQTLQPYLSVYADPVDEKKQILSNSNENQLAGFIHMLRLYEELKSLDNQVSWTLEESAETKEGREHLYALLHQFEQKAVIVTSLVNERLLRSQVSEKVFPLNTPTLF